MKRISIIAITSVMILGQSYAQTKSKEQSKTKVIMEQISPTVYTTDTGLQQIYILPRTEKGIVQWLQPVTDEEYNTVTKK